MRGGRGSARAFRNVRGALLVGLLVVVTVVAACDLISSERNVTAFRITNETDRAVDITFVNEVGPGEEDPVFRDLDAHSSVAITDKFRGDICMSGLLIARDNEGTEVARRDGDICLPGEWIIKAPDASG